MKHMKLWMLAAILFCGVVCVTSCNGNSNKDNAADTDSVVAQEIEEDIVTRDSIGFPVFGTLYNYLVDSIGSRYSQGDVCIPSIVITAAGNPDSEDDLIKILGDFWVFNYKIVGDTLKMVSGGSHPGAITFRETAQGIEVASFDQVEDGSNNVASAKRIFGDMYEAFKSVNSNEEAREDVRAQYIAHYVKVHNLPVKYYQDFGWPAKEIPVK